MNACSLQQSDTDIFLREAESAKNSDRFSEAEDLYAKVAALHTTNDESRRLQLSAFLGLATCYLHSDQFSAATDACQRSLSLCKEIYGHNNSLKATILFKLASAQEGLNDYDKAIATYNEVIALCQDFPNHSLKVCLPLIKLGDLELRRHNFALALEFYEKANTIQSLPETLKKLLIYRLVIAYLYLGNNQRADSLFRACLPAPKYTDPIFDYTMTSYIKFLKNTGHFTQASSVERTLIEWNIKHSAYRKWLLTKISPDSRFITTLKYLEKDLSTLPVPSLIK